MKSQSTMNPSLSDISIILNMPIPILSNANGGQILRDARDPETALGGIVADGLTKLIEQRKKATR